MKDCHVSTSYLHQIRRHLHNHKIIARIPTVHPFPSLNPPRPLPTKIPFSPSPNFQIPISPNHHHRPPHQKTTAAAMAAALQHTPITFRSRSVPSPHLQSKPIVVKAASLSSTFKLPKLSLNRRRGGGGAIGARMAESAAGSYANALADIATSNNTLDQTVADVEKLDKLFSDDTVLEFFTNPTIIEEEKRAVVDEIAKSADLQPHVANFLNILVDMKRIGQIKEIAKEFELVYNRLTETELAVVSSVVPLEAQHLAQIAKEVQKLTAAKNVRIKTVIDPTLVAGFTIRYGGSGSKLIDMSVKKQLEEIAAQLEIGDIQLV